LPKHWFTRRIRRRLYKVQILFEQYNYLPFYNEYKILLSDFNDIENCICKNDTRKIIDSNTNITPELIYALIDKYSLGFELKRDRKITLDSIVSLGNKYSIILSEKGNGQLAIEVTKSIIELSDKIQGIPRMGCGYSCPSEIKSYENLGEFYFRSHLNKDQRNAIKIIKSLCLKIINNKPSSCGFNVHENHASSHLSIMLGHLYNSINLNDSASYYYCNALNEENIERKSDLFRYDNGEDQYKSIVENIKKDILNNEEIVTERIKKEQAIFNLNPDNKLNCKSMSYRGDEINILIDLNKSFSEGIDQIYLGEDSKVIFYKNRSFKLRIDKIEVSGKYSVSNTIEYLGMKLIVPNHLVRYSPLFGQ
jgi:hypothetical protein